MANESVTADTVKASEQYTTWTDGMSQDLLDLVTKHNFTSIEDVLEHAKKFEGIKEEGYVPFKVPDESSSPEDVAKYKETIGGAKTIEDYDMDSFGEFPTDVKSMVAEALLSGGCSPWQAQQVAKTLADIHTKTEEAKRVQGEKDFARLSAELGLNLKPTFQKIAALSKHFGLSDGQLDALLYKGDDVVQSVKKVSSMASALLEGASFAVNKNQAVGSLEKIKSRITALARKVAEGDAKAKIEFNVLCAQQADLIRKYQS
ncbi:hypothetical protein [Candidatus Liberibacter sp.]|uniref:hypothetical protein n=1 Tax=Candidatus Liberibacter sp. TaxID=34022 RepID=UPI0015F684F3|nr:hypothetical protein [Candidatus Liberibacter sp.]MBA5724580.1 hypothetical protein [Candidatus Liberibacter sp.]